MAGRPRTAIGTYGAISTRRRDGRAIAETRIRDSDGRVRQVRVRARTADRARSILRQRLVSRPGFGSDGVLRPDSSFSELAELWLADLEARDIAESTKHGYRAQLRLHVRPAFEHYTLAEITTGRVERLLRTREAASYSQVSQRRGKGVALGLASDSMGLRTSTALIGFHVAHHDSAERTAA